MHSSWQSLRVNWSSSVSFPESIPSRETFYLEKISAGDFDAEWCTFTHVVDGTAVTYAVFTDALMIDGVRINVTAAGAQRIADMLDASLPTTYVADLMYAYSSNRLPPKPMPISSSVTAMVTHSNAVRSSVVRGKLNSTVGKHWVLHPSLAGRPEKACNYGWHFDTSSRNTNVIGVKGFDPDNASLFQTNKNVKVIQPPGTVHNALHADYSQTCQLVSQTVRIDGMEVRFEDALVDSRYSKFLTGGGPCEVTRQPGVDRRTGPIVMLPMYIKGG